MPTLVSWLMGGGGENCNGQAIGQQQPLACSARPVGVSLPRGAAKGVCLPVAREVETRAEACPVQISISASVATICLRP